MEVKIPIVDLHLKASRTFDLPTHLWSLDAVVGFSLVPATSQSYTHHVVDNNRGGLVGAVVDCQS